MELLQAAVRNRPEKPDLRGRGRGPLNLAGYFNCVLRDLDGNVKDEWMAPNIVVDEGLNHALTVLFTGAGQVAAWFVLLKDNTGDPLDGSETYGTKVFTELTDYDEATRPAYVEGAASGESIDNSGTPASFAINATITVFGAALVSVNTKGDSGAGTMFCAANFASSKALSAGDTLEVTYTITSADDGV